MSSRATGLNTHRFRDNPEEKAFAEAWAKLAEHPASLLAHLLDVRDVKTWGPPEPTEREEVVAATVIQWLGSPVGRGFLRGLGYEKREKAK